MPLTAKAILPLKRGMSKLFSGVKVVLPWATAMLQVPQRTKAIIRIMEMPAKVGSLHEAATTSPHNYDESPELAMPFSFIC